MAHTNDTGTSMYPFAQSGETINGLADGDVKGIQTIYGLPLTGTQSTVFRTTKDNVAKDTMIVEHDFVSIGTTYDDTQLLVKGKMGVNTIFPQHEVDIVGTVRATSFDGDGSSLAGVVVDADIGTTVQAYDSTIVVDADIGTTVQAYDSTILKAVDIGVNVQAYDSTIVVDADIGTTILAPNGDGSQLINLPSTGGSAYFTDIRSYFTTI
jgi:hypothetical protein